jgi:hypothetical protein
MAKKIPAKDPASGKFIKSEDNKDEEVIYDDIHNKSTEEIVAEPEEKEEVVEEKVEEPIKKEEPVKEEVDVEKIKLETKAETTKEITDRIVTSLKGKNAPEEEISETKKLVRDFMAKQQALGKQPSWEDAFEFLAENATTLAVKRIEEKKISEQQKQEELQKQTEEQKKAYLDNFKKNLDEEFAELYEKGKLPKIIDPKDKEDYGAKVQNKLLETMMNVNKERVAKGLQPITSVTRIFNTYFEAPRKEVAGYDAPVSAGRGGTHVDNTQEIDYREIHGKRFEDLVGR